MRMTYETCFHCSKVDGLPQSNDSDLLQTLQNRHSEGFALHSYLSEICRDVGVFFHGFSLLIAFALLHGEAYKVNIGPEPGTRYYIVACICWRAPMLQLSRQEQMIIGYARTDVLHLL